MRTHGASLSNRTFRFTKKEKALKLHHLRSLLNIFYYSVQMKTLDGRPPEHKPRNAEIITRSAKWKKSHRSLIRRQKAQAKTLMAALSNVSPQHSIPLLQTIGNNGTSIIHPTITTELPELLPLVYPPTPDNKPTQIKTHIQQHQDKIRAMIRGKMLPFTLEMRLNQAYEDKKRLYLKLQETDNAATKYTIEIEIEGILMRISTYETLLQPIRRIIYYHYDRSCIQKVPER